MATKKQERIYIKVDKNTSKEEIEDIKEILNMFKSSCMSYFDEHDVKYVYIDDNGQVDWCGLSFFGSNYTPPLEENLQCFLKILVREYNQKQLEPYLDKYSFDEKLDFIIERLETLEKKIKI